MDKEEIFEMVIRELTENALDKRKEDLCDDEQQLYSEIGRLSVQAHEIVEKLSAEEQQILDDYFTKTNLIADHECAYLYVQGATDCVDLLKKLGAF